MKRHVAITTLANQSVFDTTKTCIKASNDHSTYQAISAIYRTSWILLLNFKNSVVIYNIFQILQQYFLQNLHKFFSKTAKTRIFYIAHSPSVCVIKVCSNGGATYIIREIIAKVSLNTANLMQTFEHLLSQNCAQQNS